MEDNELDLVVFVDDENNEITMEILDYFFYEGDEYAVMTEYSEDELAEDEVQECYIMQVKPVGEDEEEFVPVDEELSSRLIELYQSEDFGDDDEEE